MKITHSMLVHQALIIHCSHFSLNFILTSHISHSLSLSLF